MRQSVRRVMVTALVTAILTALLPARAQASSWMHVFIANTPGATCLAISDAGDGTIPTQQSCVDSNHQLWNVVEGSAGRYRIANNATGKCLAAASAFVVYQLTCASGTAQQWSLNGSGHTFQISNISVGNCIARHISSGAIVLGSCAPRGARWDLLF